MLSTPSAIVTDQSEDPLTRDIALLKRLRAQVLAQVVESRGYSYDLSAEFSMVRDVIDKSLSFALLRRELESDS